MFSRLDRRYACLIIAAAMCISAGSCVLTPETNRNQLIIIGKKNELKLGGEAYREIIHSSIVSRDERLVELTRRVARNVADATGQTGYHWEFELFESPIPNAFCLPGGKVGVNTGILPIAKNEAGLAAIIGHEVAHAIARHGAERMSHEALVSWMGDLLAKGWGENEAQRQRIRGAYGAGTAVVLTLPYSRSHELEADHMGLLYMARAGYDPKEAEAFWIRFRDYIESGGEEDGSGFFSTHPADSRRLRKIRKLLRRAAKEYKTSPRYGAGSLIF